MAFRGSLDVHVVFLCCFVCWVGCLERHRILFPSLPEVTAVDRVEMVRSILFLFTGECKTIFFVLAMRLSGRKLGKQNIYFSSPMSWAAN